MSGLPPPDFPMGLQWLTSTVTVVIAVIKYSVVQCYSVHKIYMYRYTNIIVHYHAHC